MMATISPPASRNSSCPCGSGRRYKDCHGRAGPAPPPAEAGPPAQELPGDLQDVMRSALAAQQAGQLDDAIAGYDAVLRARPDSFDAWHMRGVAHLLANRFDAAEADIGRALAIWPGLLQARTNLALVEGGRRNTLDEEALSRAAWPRFRHLVVERPEHPLDGAARGGRAFVIELDDRVSALCDRLSRDAVAAGAEAHRVRAGQEGMLPDAFAAMLGTTGPLDTIIGVGCRHAVGEWTLGCAPRAMALVADDGPLARVEDRLRELSGQGRRRVRLARAPGATIDLAPLPHLAMA